MLVVEISSRLPTCWKSANIMSDIHRRGVVVVITNIRVKERNMVMARMVDRRGGTGLI